MALETLKGIKEINFVPVVVMDELRETYPDKFNESGGMDYKWFEEEIRPHRFVYIRHDKNSISFTLQKGPIQENGVNGCQVDTMIEVAKTILEGLNKKLPCPETSLAITKLAEAIFWLEERTRDRIKRGVEGTNEA